MDNNFYSNGMQGKGQVPKIQQEANEGKPGTDHGLVLVIDALLREAGVPYPLAKKIFWLLSDNEQPTDWAIIGDFSSFLARLVAIKTLKEKCQKSELAKNSYLDNALKSWWNDWYGRKIFHIDSDYTIRDIATEPKERIKKATAHSSR